MIIEARLNSNNFWSLTNEYIEKASNITVIKTYFKYPSHKEINSTAVAAIMDKRVAIYENPLYLQP